MRCDFLGKLSGDQPIVLELDLARGLIEHRPTNPLEALKGINATTLPTLRTKLRDAAKDKNVRGLIVHAVNAGQPAPVIEETARIIEEFGESKPTVAWAEEFNGLSTYALATAAQKVWLQPTSEMMISGVEVHITLLKGLMNKVGVEPQFGQRHEYKSAAETYSADEISDANREMMQSLGQSIVDEFVTDIARRRDLTTEAVWEAVNAGVIVADDAQGRNLIDHLGYRDQVYAAALEEWASEPDELRFVLHYRGKLNVPEILAKRTADKVAVVSLKGGIMTGRGSQGGPGGDVAGSDVVDEQLRQALRDDKVKAVVFTIDSPGGSATASDFIRRGVLRLKEAGKPVVASMGSVAASGGYYAAMGCTEIVTHATTLTGSIGVFAGKLITQGLYEKLGLKREAIRIGAQAGFLSPVDEFDEKSWEMLNQMLDRIYKDFTTFAAEDRGMAYDELEALARGRVWTGRQALERGLVDHIGGPRQALERACDLAGLDADQVALERMGHIGLLDRFTPARSSESNPGAGVGIDVPDAEALLRRAAAALGVTYSGALSLPFTISVQ